jgi:hypothetical protein
MDKRCPPECDYPLFLHWEYLSGRRAFAVSHEMATRLPDRVREYAIKLAGRNSDE